MRATALLLSAADVQIALGPRVLVDTTSVANAEAPGGNLLKGAALDTAYRRFTGRLDVDTGTSPVTIGVLSLVFDSGDKARRTFNEVGQAAHLRTEVEGTNVAVETVTAPNGLVSYWGFVHRNEVITILTLDTIDPQELSVADLRSLVIAAAHRLDATVTKK